MRPLIDRPQWTSIEEPMPPRAFTSRRARVKGKFEERRRHVGKVNFGENQTGNIQIKRAVPRMAECVCMELCLREATLGKVVFEGGNIREGKGEGAEDHDGWKEATHR